MRSRSGSSVARSWGNNSVREHNISDKGRPSTNTNTTTLDEADVQRRSVVPDKSVCGVGLGRGAHVNGTCDTVRNEASIENENMSLWNGTTIP